MPVQGFLRSQARSVFQSILYRAAREQTADDLRRPAVVFAPHQDDETLGCGGTVLLKRRAGAAVTVVFMTDGSRSHRQFLSASAIKDLRRAEAEAACRVLGVEDVRFLDYEDGSLRKHQAEAAGRVLEILRECQPQDVYLPHRQDWPLDHVATAQAVLAALKQYPARAFEYPVWFWQCWPWMAAPQGQRERQHYRRGTLIALRALLRREFRAGVTVSDVLGQKRAALAEHKTQVTHYNGDPAWITLDEVAQGTFVPCFFHPREVFRVSAR